MSFFELRPGRKFMIPCLCVICGDSTVNRSLIVMCEYIVNKSANGLGGKNRGIVYREKILTFFSKSL
jgi:hypothetical protein